MNKNKVCPLFQKGKCVAGDICNYSHDIHDINDTHNRDENKENIEPKSQNQNEFMKIKEICPLLIKGKCDLGKDCQNSHDFTPLVDACLEIGKNNIKNYDRNLGPYFDACIGPIRKNFDEFYDYEPHKKIINSDNQIMSRAKFDINFKNAEIDDEIWGNFDVEKYRKPLYDNQNYDAREIESKIDKSEKTRMLLNKSKSISKK